MNSLPVWNHPAGTYGDCFVAVNPDYRMSPPTLDQSLNQSVPRD